MTESKWKWAGIADCLSLAHSLEVAQRTLSISSGGAVFHLVFVRLGQRKRENKREIERGK
jgi:hypothetical protein